MADTIIDIDILLVEDDKDDTTLFLRALQNAKLKPELRIAWNGIEALALIFGAGNPYDAVPVVRPKLVILDLSIPKANGLEILDRLKKNQNTQAIPVIVMSSSERKQDIGASYHLGANSYAIKPTNFDKLTELVQLLVRYWLEFNQRYNDDSR